MNARAIFTLVLILFVTADCPAKPNRLKKVIDRYILWKKKCHKDKEVVVADDDFTIGEAVVALSEANVTLIRDDDDRVTSVSFPTGSQASLLKYLAKFNDLRGLAIRGMSCKEGDLKPLETLEELQMVFLRQCNLSKAAAKDLARLPTVEDLFMENTNLDDGRLLTISKLPKLSYLDLKSTNVTTYGVTEFCRLRPKVTVRAQADHANPRDVAKLFTRLGGEVHFDGNVATEIDLAKTKVKDDDLRHLQWLPTVYELDISHTNITGDAVQHIVKLPKLRTLRNRGSKLTTNDLVAIVKVHSHLEIDDPNPDPKEHVVDDAKIKQIIPPFSERISSAKAAWTFMDWEVDAKDIEKVNAEATANLWFIDCTVEKSAVAKFFRLRKMTGIHFLGGNNELLTYFKTVDEQWAERIEKLTFQRANLKDEEIELLHCFPNLRELSITGTKISNDSFAEFAAMPKLRSLSLFDAGLSMQAKKKLAAALPDCIIYTD